MKQDKKAVLQITAVVENESCLPELEARHGLCVHIETDEHSILFDLGRDSLLLENSTKLGIDLTKVDIVVLSHGHADHGGALPIFLTYNKKAKIYLREEAFIPLYLQKGEELVYSGLDQNYHRHPQLIFTEERYDINHNIHLFSGVVPGYLNPSSNQYLYQKSKEDYVHDDFCHEQNMILHREGKYILFAGCAHSGIINILKKAEKQINGTIDIVIGGFHLFNPGTLKYESDELIDLIAEELKKTKTIFYTCHCTGKYAFERMKKTLGDQVQYFSTGTIIKL